MTAEEFIKLAVIFMYAVILHECAHGWVANKLGDPTAKNLGRLTLNPIKHIDPIGTLILPCLLVYLHAPYVFGWAKPVPVNFLGLRNPKRDMMWVGLAGPLVNIILAIFFSQFLPLNFSVSDHKIIESAIIINLVLATFNMIPIPPLDGSRLMMGLLPNRYAFYFARLENYGFVLVLLLLSIGFLDKVVWPIVGILASYLGVH